jgi:predicted amidophosphoribosyltransferase
MFIGTFIEKVKMALQNPVCLLCNNRLGTPDQFCVSCQDKLGIRHPEPIIDNAYCHCHAATTFNPTVKRLVYGHKFYNRIEHISQLTGLLVEYWDRAQPFLCFDKVHPENVLVIPIPPHAGQPSLIDMFASRFARHFGYDYHHQALSWIRDVRPQHRIHEKAERFSNISQSLYLKSGLVSGYEKIIVIDDITTTGATMLEASRAFRNEVGTPSRWQDDVICLAVTKVPLGTQSRSGRSMSEAS